KPGHGNPDRSTPSKGSPSRTPAATSTPRSEMPAPAGGTTCIATNPDDSSSDSSTTGRRSSNSTHQTSPRCMCPPGQETAGEYCARPSLEMMQPCLAPDDTPIVHVRCRVGV